MEGYKTLKNILASDGYTAGEQLFLDSEQAKIAASGICRIVTEEMDIIKNNYNRGIQDASEVFASCSNVPWGFILSSYETEVAYSEGGLNYETTIGIIQNRFHPVVDKAKQLEKRFYRFRKANQRRYSEKN